MNTLPLGFALLPPAEPWGINLGGGVNSTAAIIECRRRGLKPDWILFANTGSELPGTLEHVQRVTQWARGWCDVTTVKWDRVRGEVLGFEPLHENCLRTRQLPSKAYGLAGCTTKWKIQPMDRWRKARGFQRGAFLVGYDADEKARIKTACERGDDPAFVAWYALVAWKLGRQACIEICESEGLPAGKSSCWMCPNMNGREWTQLRRYHPEFYGMAITIDRTARENGHLGRGGKGLFQNGRPDDMSPTESTPNALEDRCHHGGCFT